MTDIQWKPSYNTGIAEIDLQHRQLVRNLDEVLKELVDYKQTHFIFEEQLMRSMDYEFFFAHQHVKELFTARIIRYKRPFDRGEDVAGEVYDLLKRWLTKPILHDDKNFVKIHQAQKVEEEYKKKHVLVYLFSA